jgi:hypothetical protein
MLNRNPPGKSRLAAWVYCALAAAGSVAVASAQEARPQEFSAQIIGRDAAGLTLGAGAKIYVANRMVRIESSESPDGFFLIDAGKGTASFVLPRQRIFMDARQSNRLTQVFVPIDTDDPCPQWRAAADLAKALHAMDQWRCERAIGAATEGGRTLAYRVAAAQGADLRWIDSDLKFPVRQRADDGTTLTLEDLRIEAQPPDLFVIPSGFRRLDPQALIERIKHSDVWVDP